MSRLVKYAKILRRGSYALAVLLCTMVAIGVVSRYQYQRQVAMKTEEVLLQRHAEQLFAQVRAGIELHRLQPGLLTSFGKSWSAGCLDESGRSALQDWVKAGTAGVQGLTQRLLIRSEKMAKDTPQVPVLMVADGALGMTSSITLGRLCDRPWWLLLESRSQMEHQRLRHVDIPFVEMPQLHVAVKVDGQLVRALNLVAEGDWVSYRSTAIAADLPWSLVPGQSQVTDGRFQMLLADERTGLSMAFVSAPLVQGGGLQNFVRINALTLGLLLGLTLTTLGMLVLLRHAIEVSERLHHLSTRDPLTGLFNRRAAGERTIIEHARALRSGRGFCVVQLDIDHFKRVNDTYGHDGGDAVLQFLAARLQEAVRQEDMVARMGGEEFLMLLPETDLQDARQVVERLRHTLRETPACYGEQRITATCSFGLSAWGGADDSLQALLTRTDLLLYRAKQQGRDRCVDDLNDTTCRAQPA